MRVFVSLKALRGDPALEALADLAAAVVSRAGHQAVVATREITRLGLADPLEFMPYVRQLVTDCDLMLVLYHPELRGGLIEIGLAYAHHIPIWLCAPVGEYVSSSACGCADLRIEYNSLPHLEAQLSTQLRDLRGVE